MAHVRSRLKRSGAWLRAAAFGALVGPAAAPAEPVSAEIIEVEQESAGAVATPSPGARMHERLARGDETAASETSASPLGHALCLLSGLDRTALLASCATSTDEAIRRELARALSAPFDAVGLRTALEHLEGDPSPEVRRLARLAAATRRASLG